MSELLPCPFCGSDNVVLEDCKVRKGYEAYVQCNGGCMANQHTITYETLEEAQKEAIKMWNTRSRFHMPEEMYRYMFDNDDKAVAVKCKVGKITRNGFTLVHYDGREWNYKYEDVGKYVFYTKEEVERLIKEAGINKPQ